MQAFIIALSLITGSFASAQVLEHVPSNNAGQISVVQTKCYESGCMSFSSSGNERFFAGSDFYQIRNSHGLVVGTGQLSSRQWQQWTNILQVASPDCPATIKFDTNNFAVTAITLACADAKGEVTVTYRDSRRALSSYTLGRTKKSNDELFLNTDDNQYAWVGNYNFQKVPDTLASKFAVDFSAVSETCPLKVTFKPEGRVITKMHLGCDPNE